MFAVLPHRAADERDLAPAVDADVGGLLHPVDVRGERRDEDPALAAREDLAERLADDALRLASRPAARRSSSRRAGGRRRGCRPPRAGRRRCAARRPACGRACSRRCGRSGRPASRARPRPRRGSSAPSARARAGTGRAATGSSPGASSRSSAARSEPVLVELRLDEREREPRRDARAARAPRA